MCLLLVATVQCQIIIHVQTTVAHTVAKYTNETVEQNMNILSIIYIPLNTSDGSVPLCEFENESFSW